MTEHTPHVSQAPKLDAAGLSVASCSCGWRGRIGTRDRALAAAREHATAKNAARNGGVDGGEQSTLGCTP